MGIMNSQRNPSAILQAAAHLLHVENSEAPSAPSSTLKILLEGRLRAFYSERGEQDEPFQFDTLAAVQLATAIEALSTVEEIDKILRADEFRANVFGTRDWRILRTLIAMVFKWGIDPLLYAVCKVRALDYQTLSQITTRILTLLFPNGVKNNISTTPIAVEVAERHTTDVLRPALTLGWLPKSLTTPKFPVVNHIRPFIVRLLSTLSPALLITALGKLTSSHHGLPQYAIRTASSFLSQQLLRPGGVLGLCESVFGTEEALGEDVPFDKLQKVSLVLMSVPAIMDPTEYFRHIVSRVIHLLADNTPNSYRKIAAYTLSQMLGSDKAFAYKDTAGSVIYSTLHKPFELPPSGNEAGSGNDPSALKAAVALSRLLVLISNCDPSPETITNILSPIVPALYSFLFHLTNHKTSDPRLRERVLGLLSTWGKIVDARSAIDVLWTIIVQAERMSWKLDIEGNFSRCETTEKSDPLSLLLPTDKTIGEDEPDINTNLFQFYPDPVHFVSFLKTLDRSDVVSELFIRLLEAYRDQRMKGRRQDPMMALHYLQIFMQMQLQLLDATSSSILRQPEQLLSFIKQVLESSSQVEADTIITERRGPEILRLDLDDSDNYDDEIVSEADSDDDDPASDVVKPDDDLLETTLNLLLSILESYEDLSVRKTPLLNDIFVLLDSLSLNGSSNLRALSREARIVITARSASSSTMGHQPKKGEKESDQEKYQKALKLLQDPILPVRAYGLFLLRELVADRPSENDNSTVNPSLAPAILAIFLQSIQDEDSYIFLNGVQGLAAMVNRFGQEVLSNLVREYSDGLERNGAWMSEQELDVRVRIGEALSIVIRRCGTSLGKYRDPLVPALFRVFRLRDIPVTLRTSSLSLLADAIDTCPIVMLPYIEDLAQSMVDLLQVETQVDGPTPTEPPKEAGNKGSHQVNSDTDHLAANAKYPPFRRAALHLLGLLVHSTIRGIEESRLGIPFSGDFMKRARITLGYIASTDNDGVVKLMAQELKEELTTLNSYILG